MFSLQNSLCLNFSGDKKTVHVFKLNSNTTELFTWYCQSCLGHLCLASILHISTSILSPLGPTLSEGAKEGTTVCLNFA